NLAQLLPGDLNVSYLPNSGGESVEGALKMAYKYHDGKRRFVLHSDISFHGKLLGCGSVTGSRETSYNFQEIPNVETFRYNDLESVREQISKLRDKRGGSDVYALIVEPFSASSLRETSEEFLRGLREICTQEEIVLIFDEVYTGWGKTGELFHFMRHEGLVPDILTSSKSFGGGKATVSLYVAREPIFRKAYDNLNDFTLHSSTYNAFGEESITALEAVNIVVEDDYPAKARHIGERLGSGLRHLKEKHPKILQEVLGIGGLRGIMINPGPKVLQAATRAVPVGMFKDKQFLNKLTTCAVISELYAAHGILTSFGANERIVLWIAPALIVTDEEIDLFLDGLDKTLDVGLLSLVLKLLKSKFFQR
ncbi:MAG: aminotransferase class III-fold pyridoxal phosphate-dependent enzyme, partial [Opitutales bacterium]